MLIPVGSERADRRPPYATYALIAINLIVFVWEQTAGEMDVVISYGFVPANPNWLSLISSMFIHSGWAHLIGNMVFLWVFGSLLEDAVGPPIFLLLYFGGQLGATMLHVAIAKLYLPRGVLDKPVVGASGAVAAVMGLVTLRFYRTPIRIFYWLFFFYVGVFELAAWVFIGLWMAIQVMSGIYQVTGGGGAAAVAYWAHIGGFGFGAAAAAALGLHREGQREYLLQESKVGLGLSETGAANLERMAKQDHADPGLRMAVARQLESEHRYQEAGRQYLQAISLHLARADRAGAVEAYRELVGRFPDCVLEERQQFDIAAALEEQGYLREAVLAFDRLAEALPESAQASLSLLRAGQICLAKLANPTGAASYFSRLIENYPVSEWRPLAEERLRMAQGQGPGSR